MNNSNDGITRAGGAFADGLTLIRALLTPIVMYLIIAKGWPSQNIAILVSVLFAVAALTDFFDDVTGGAETSVYRKFGWFDDIADTVLMVGTLAAMVWVFMSAAKPDIVVLDDKIDIINPGVSIFFLVPVGIIIARELIVGLVKGFEMSKSGFYETGLGNLKTAMIMLGTCILLASPWISPWLTSVFSKGGDVPKGPVDLSDPSLMDKADPGVFDAYANMWGLVWNTGLVILWIGAVLSLITGLALLSGKSGPANDG